MFVGFFYHLRQHRLPVSVQEYLALLDALRHGIMPPTLEDFYYLARMTLIKDETRFDRFDQAFGSYFQGREAQLPDGQQLPADWLIQTFQKTLSPEEKAALKK